MTRLRCEFFVIVVVVVVCVCVLFNSTVISTASLSVLGGSTQRRRHHSGLALVHLVSILSMMAVIMDSIALLLKVQSKGGGVVL